MRASSPRIKPGTQFGPYTLKEPIGKGASAVVWRGETSEGRSFAIKTRRRGDASMDRRFLREFESMRSLRLPGVVRVYEAGIEEHHLWFSMDLVGGQSFYKPLDKAKNKLARIRLVVDQALQLAEIVEALHQAGFIHRDLKPSNVLVDEDNQVHVLDFGIVSFFATSESTLTTHTGAVLGTIPFMAPEQLSGMPNDASVDVFAIGLMIHEGINGRRPRPAVPIGWIPRTCMERLAPLATLHKEVPRSLSHLVEDMLSVDPRQRPAASKVARSLRAMARGHDSPDCPEPAFIEPGEWLSQFDGLLGHPGSSAIWVMEGPAGSGKRRAAEQLHRLGIMQGVWPLHLHCRIDVVGGPLVELLELLLSATDEEGWSTTVVGEDGALLRRMWPQLHLPGAREEAEFPTVEQVTEAVARCVARSVAYRPSLIILHDLEQVDSVTARGLSHIADECGPSLGLLLLHDPRWATRDSKRAVQRLKTRNEAGYQRVPLIKPETARAIAQSLCPNASIDATGVNTPQEAVERGLQALAKWRGDTMTPFGTSLWPLAVRDAPVPANVLTRVAGPELMKSPWVTATEGGMVLAAAFARRAARARMPDAQKAAATLCKAWLAEYPEGGDDIATLLLLAGSPGDAWMPAARSALTAERLGSYDTARRWLFLLDTLPRPREIEPDLHFGIALVRARIALRTEVGKPRRELLQTCEAIAEGPEQAARARLLRAEYDLREGHATRSLVAALRVSSNMSETAPRVMVRGLLGAAMCRFVLGQIHEVPLQLDKARMVLLKHPDPLLSVQLDNLRAEYLLRNNDLPGCRTLSQQIIRSAAEAHYVRGAAFAASRLGRVLRMLGRRREAEHQTRSARDGFASTGDVVLNAETGLALATLLVERGDTPGARHLLDESIRHIRGLHLNDLLPGAMRVALEVAIFRADPTDAAVALAVLAESSGSDPEIPSVLVRWWRIRGDIDRAMAVDQPKLDGYGRVLWHIERARVAMMAGWNELADEQAQAAIEGATEGDFDELRLYARLVLGVVMPESAPHWPRIMNRAASSMRTEVYLGALEMDARRLFMRGKREESRARWRTLWARSKELGYEPGVEETEGWLTSMDSEDTTLT